jgi:hypothetical protein
VSNISKLGQVEGGDAVEFKEKVDRISERHGHRLTHALYTLTTPSGQASQTAARRRQGHMPDATLTQLDDERCEAGLDVVEQAGITPVPLGGEVDDGARRGLVELEGEHPTWLNVSLATGPRVEGVVGRVEVLALEREPLAHHPHTVDRVDERLRCRGEDIARCVLDHATTPFCYESHQNATMMLFTYSKASLWHFGLH